MKEKRIINELLVRSKNYFNLKSAGTREIIRRLLLLLCIAVFVYFSYGVVEKWYNDYVNKLKYESMVAPNETGTNNIFNPIEEDIDAFKLLEIGTFTEISSSYLIPDIEETTGDVLSDNGSVISSAYMDYLQINKDIIAHISISGTEINHYVTQYKLDNEYYLHKNLEGAYAYAGSIFMDYRNRLYGEDKNTILFGHNMNNGGMFATLHRYKDRDFANEHIYITFDTMYESMTWQIFASYKAVLATDFDYIQVSFGSDEEFEKFISNAKSKSSIKYEASPTKYDRILTLSTCDARKGERYVVQAMLISKTKK